MYNEKSCIRQIPAAAAILCTLCLFFSINTHAAFEELITTGARAHGMGEAFCGISGDASGILINPATIGSLKSSQFSFTGSFPYLGFLENDLLMNHFSVFALPLMKGHAVGAGINYFKADKYNEFVAFGTYAYNIFDELTIAGTLKYLSWDSALSRFYDSSGQPDEEDLSYGGISVDAGLMYRPAEEVSVGFAVTDINQPNIVSAQSVGKCTDTLPLGLRAGFSYTVNNFIFDFDYIYRYFRDIYRVDSYICMGTERSLKDLTDLPVTLRGGVTFMDMVEGMNVSLGASYGENRSISEINETKEKEAQKKQGEIDVLQKELGSLEKLSNGLEQGIADTEGREQNSVHQKAVDEIQAKKDYWEKKINSEIDQLNGKLNNAKDEKTASAVRSQLSRKDLEKKKMYGYIDEMRKKILVNVKARIKTINSKINSLSASVASLEQKETLEPFRYRVDYSMIMSLTESVLLTHRFSFSAEMLSFEEMVAAIKEPRNKQAEKKEQEDIGGAEEKQEEGSGVEAQEPAEETENESGEAEAAP